MPRPTSLPAVHASRVLICAALALGGCPSSDPPTTAGDTGTLDATVETDGVQDAGPPPVFCTGTTAYLYDPLGGAGLTTFPDDYYSVADTGSLTGRRVSIGATNAPWFTSIPSAVAPVFEQLNTLDGFGTTAGITLRFTDLVGDVPSGETDSTTSEVLQLLDLGGTGPPTRIPFEVQVTDEGTTIILLPMVPLEPKRRHAVVLTTGHLATDGSCIAPSQTMQDLLTGAATDPGLAQLVPRYAELLSRTGLRADDISAAVVFTTQSIVETSIAIAEDIATRQPVWLAPPTCVDEALYRVCEGSFEAWDYRQADGIIKGIKPVTVYEVPVTLWLPIRPGGTPGDGWPTMVFGHGLTGSRHQAQELADLAGPLGFATIAIDSPHHGDHPAGTGTNDLFALIGFFGFILEPDLGVNGLVLRDNWRQGTYDKLQLIQLLLNAPDIDGDGTPELDPSKLVYLGASLGGIMGSELLALTDRFGMGILMVGGGRVATIIQEAAQFEIVITLMKPDGTSDGDVERFFPILQTVVEAGDAANYAPYVLTHRLAPGGTTPPHILLTNALDDDTVPPGTNRALARAYRTLSHLAPVLDPVGIIPVVASGPIVGNLTSDDGQPLTAALFQYDRITKSEGGEVQKAKHGNVPASRESFAQASRFLETWLDTGLPEVIDPYAELGTPPLPASP